MGTGGSTPGRPAAVSRRSSSGAAGSVSTICRFKKHALCRVASFVGDGQDALDDKRLFGTSGERHGGTVSGLYRAPAGQALL